MALDTTLGRARAVFCLLTICCCCCFYVYREAIDGSMTTLTRAAERMFSDQRVRLATFNGERIGMGCAVTLRNIRSVSVLRTISPFFIRLFPSFCRTASAGYNYTFFIAYDFNDHILNGSLGRDAFATLFNSMAESLCKTDISATLRFIQCNHTGQPARAQNDALMAAYHAGMDYLYMINDDTDMKTTQWTKRFIEQLAKFNPPNVGLVGPIYREGNTVDLTYNFVHRTHVNIFKCFYPPFFTDWYADQWISRVYKPNNVMKLRSVQISHTMEMDTRYKVDRQLAKWLDPLILRYQQLHLRPYIEARGLKWNEWISTKSTKVIKTD